MPRRRTPIPEPAHSHNVAAASHRKQQDKADAAAAPPAPQQEEAAVDEPSRPAETEGERLLRSTTIRDDPESFTRHRAGLKAALKNPIVKPETKERVRRQLEEEEQEGPQVHGRPPTGVIGGAR